MQDHCHGLSSFRLQGYTWTVDASFVRGIWRKLTSNKFRQRYAAPLALAQQFMCSRQRPYAMAKSSNEVRMRSTNFLCLLNDRSNRREHVLYAVVEFSIQQASMFLSSSPRSDIACDF